MIIWESGESIGSIGSAFFGADFMGFFMGVWMAFTAGDLIVRIHLVNITHRVGLWEKNNRKARSI